MRRKPGDVVMPRDPLHPSRPCLDTPVQILCLGDVVGKQGRQTVQEYIPRLRDRFNLTLVVANGENAAGGLGLTKATAAELFKAGIDVLTTGNHIWKHRDAAQLLDLDPRVLRPANFSPGVPGTGIGIYEAQNGLHIAVINLIGRTYMGNYDCPFRTVETLLQQIPTSVSIILVDFHAEATSEKKALAHFLDGNVSAVFGTHTHVQTADPMIFPQGTAAITDLGMCGCEVDSVLGMDPHSSINRLYTGIPGRYVPARGTGSLNGILLSIDPLSGNALTIQLVRSGLLAALDYRCLSR